MAQQRATGQELENANAKAKEQFLSAYEGSTISITTTFHHRQVVRAYKRTFAIVLRNWFLATNIARANIEDKTLAAKIEAAMLTRVGEVKHHFKQGIEQCNTLIESAQLDRKYITHETGHTDEVRFLGPVAMRFREVLLECDRYLDLINLLWTFGEITEKAHADANFDVRTRLRGIDATVRNHWQGVRTRINDAGQSRPNYKADKAVKVDGETTTEAVPAAAQATEELAAAA